MLRSRGVEVAVRVEERLGLVRRRLGLQLQERRVHLGELDLELFDEDLSTLVHPHELGLRRLDRLLEVLLDRTDPLHDLTQRCLGQQTLALEDAGYLVVGLEGLVLEVVDPLCVVVSHLHEVTPTLPVVLVLATEVAHQTAQLLDVHGSSEILDVDDRRNSCTFRCGRLCHR